MPAHKLFLFGIDSAGKTALVKSIKGEDATQTKPTLAFHIVKLRKNQVEFQIWDAPGQRNLRRIWNNGFNRAKLLVFVVDTSDDERFSESKDEFMKVISEPDTKELPVIFCYHKMDLAESKANLDKAKEFFDPKSLEGREVVEMETSIYEQESVGFLVAEIFSWSEKL